MTKILASETHAATLESLGLKRPTGITSQTLKSATKLAMQNYMRSSPDKHGSVSTSTALFVLRTICEYGRKGATLKDGRIEIRSRPSIQTLASDIHRNEKTVRRAIAFLKVAVGLRADRKPHSKDASGKPRTKLYYSVTLPTTPDITNGENLSLLTSRERLARQVGDLRLSLDRQIEDQRVPTLVEALAKTGEAFADPDWMIAAARSTIRQYVPNYRGSSMDDLIETRALACIEIVSYCVRENIALNHRAGMLTTNLKHCAAGQRFYRDKMKSDHEIEVEDRIEDLKRIDETVRRSARKISITQCEAHFKSYMSSAAAAALARQQIAATAKAVSA